MTRSREQVEETAAFLHAVLAPRTEAEVYRVEIFPAPPYRANNFNDLEKMAAHLLKFGEKPFNAYFALATYPAGGTDRLASSALRFGSLWADLDCGPGKKFRDKSAALSRLEAFTLPATVIVDSGRGVHAYWKLAQPVDGEDANELIGLIRGMAGDWGGDPATALRSQILRAPGTWNVDSVKKAKDGTDYPVRLLRLHQSAPGYELGDFIEAGVRPAAKEKQPPLPDTVSTGTRHLHLVVEAARLRNMGYDAVEIDALLQVLNDRRCETPVPEEEVRAIAKWAGTLKPGAVVVPRFTPARPRGPIRVA